MKKIILFVTTLLVGSSTALAAPSDGPSLQPRGSNTIHVSSTWLGVHLVQITPELRSFFGAPEDAGVLVAQVIPESPAHDAGIKVGDVIADVDGEPTRTVRDVIGAVSTREAGTRLSLTVVRDQQEMALSATLAQRALENKRPAIEEEWRDLPGGSSFRRLFRHQMGDGFDPDMRGFHRGPRRNPEALRKKLQKLEERIEELERR